jgi:hypothetical protein
MTASEHGSSPALRAQEKDGKMKFAIRNRWNASIIFEAEIECGADDSEGAKLGLAVKAAVKARANLARANLARAYLADADLRSFKADMWITLAQNRAEVSGLIKALREGRVDGSQYEGECACLVGTIANVKGTSYAALDYDSDNPAERWFMMIRKGDKPEDDSGGGFAAQKALEWAEEFCTVHGIELDQPRGLSAADAPCAEGVNPKARQPNDP